MTIKRLAPIFVTAVAAAVLAVPASASADASIIELGGKLPKADVSCPQNCQAIGQVSGYQTRVGTIRNPFRASRRGKIVAFSIVLGRPKASQIDFFDKLFGGPASVRLSVVRPGSKQRHRLTGQSEVFPLEDYFGSTPTFVLSRPLTVKKGYVVVLTVPTWAPAFAVNLTNDQAWRASRGAKQCDNVQQQAAQQVRGSLTTYACTYKTARLLYTAVMIPSPSKTPPPKPPKKKNASSRG